MVELSTPDCTPLFAGKGPKNLKFEPLVFEAPELEIVLHESGITIYFLEDHELPVVEASALISTGSVLEPPGKDGLASLVGEVMRTGGTVNNSPEEINETLEDMGAVVETSVGTWYGTAYLWSMKDDFEHVMSIFAEILRSPDFQQDKIEIHKERLIEGIRRMYDLPARQAGLAFYELLWGQEHPLGKLTDSLDVRSITREDMLEFHRRHFHPANIKLGISGDITLEEALAVLDKYFGDWQRGEMAELGVPEAAGASGGTYYLIPRDIDQTKVIMGHFAPTITSRDYLPLLLGNRIFGAGGIGTSRLWKEVRSDRGLAYRVRSSFNFGLVAPGSFTISVGTKTSTAIQAIQLVKSELNRLIEEGITEAELRLAKDYYINSYPFDFSRGISIVRRRMLNDYRGLPPEFIYTYPDLISDVTVDEINEAIRRHVHPDSLITVVVGNRNALEPALAEIGEVIILENHAKKQLESSQAAP